MLSELHQYKEALHVEANNPNLELRIGGKIPVYTKKQHLIHRNTKYTVDQNYKENERSIKPTEVNPRRLEQRYMEEQNEIEEMNQTQQPSWIINNISFCYVGEKCSGNDNERKQHFF